MKFICSVCGYVYDESKGVPESGIPANTKFDELPEDFSCPLCGAPKALFEKESPDEKNGAGKTEDAEKIANDDADPEFLHELTAMEASVLCSNLARGCEKQYEPEQSAAFSALAEKFRAMAARPTQAGFEEILRKIEHDLSEGFPHAQNAAKASGDRGALRALVWSEKVTRILKSLLERYGREGEAMLENTGIFVCTICGFVYVGNSAPENCPVCKVTGKKFEKIEGGR